MSDCAIAGGGPVPDGQPAALCPAPAACRDLPELLAGVTDGRPGHGSPSGRTARPSGAPGTLTAARCTCRPPWPADEAS